MTGPTLGLILAALIAFTIALLLLFDELGTPF